MQNCTIFARKLENVKTIKTLPIGELVGKKLNTIVGRFFGVVPKIKHENHTVKLVLMAVYQFLHCSQ